MSAGNIEQNLQDVWQEMQKRKEIEIEPCETNLNLVDDQHLTKLKMTKEQKLQVMELVNHFPTVLAVGNMATAYKVTFPKGLPHTLLALKQGGYGSQIFDQGKIVGSASFHPVFCKTFLQKIAK